MAERKFYIRGKGHTDPHWHALMYGINPAGDEVVLCATSCKTNWFNNDTRCYFIFRYTVFYNGQMIHDTERQEEAFDAFRTLLRNPLSPPTGH